MPTKSSSANDIKIKAQKKGNVILGKTNPAKVSPGKIKLTILKSLTITITRKRTVALTTHLKAPKVIKLMGIKSKLRSGLISRFKIVKKIAAQIRTR